jgi:arylamine N-acetyltransferase
MFTNITSRATNNFFYVSLVCEPNKPFQHLLLRVLGRETLKTLQNYYLINNVHKNFLPFENISVKYKQYQSSYIQRTDSVLSIQRKLWMLLGK